MMPEAAPHSLSLNEVDALAKKATRGTGYPWGLAEEAGKAIRWLCRNGLDGCAELLGLLEECDGADVSEWRPVIDGHVWTARSGRLCPLITGAALSDRAADLRAGVFEIGPLLRPLLILPFAGHAAQFLQGPVSVRWSGGVAVTDGEGLGLDGAHPVGPETVKVSIEGRVDDPNPERTRATPDHDCQARLERFAHRTYAPATEASRLKGAGAGLSDND